MVNLTFLRNYVASRKNLGFSKARSSGLNIRITWERFMSDSKLVDDFEIAPGYNVKLWRSLTLDEADHSAEDWGTAIAILEKRIRSRFIDPAQLLIESEKESTRGTNGFAILAIDFLLIETIQGFKKGETSHQGQSKKLFKSFLKGWDEFTACIPNGRDSDKLATTVFDQGRCALHHTGSTDRIIVRRSGKMLVFHEDGRIEINRTQFHRALSKTFDEYLKELRAPANITERKNLKKKMDHICK